MKLDSPKACNILGVVFFVLITLLESVSFCLIFGTEVYETSWITSAIIGVSTLFFNVGLWFFALTYHKTLLNLKK